MPALVISDNYALVRSMISSRSNSARAAKMPKTSLPSGNVVSMLAPRPLSTLKRMPRAVRSCTVLTWCRRSRPSRSSFQTKRIVASKSDCSNFWLKARRLRERVSVIYWRSKNERIGEVLEPLEQTVQLGRTPRGWQRLC